MAKSSNKRAGRSQPKISKALEIDVKKFAQKAADVDGHHGPAALFAGRILSMSPAEILDLVNRGAMGTESDKWPIDRLVDALAEGANHHIMVAGCMKSAIVRLGEAAEVRDLRGAARSS